MGKTCPKPRFLDFKKLVPFKKKWNTPWKTNMSPENQWLEDVFPIEIVPF